ncbi:MAG: tRNA (adenosine(37)-N6)-threonylcarbamoyltransferase complex dimerization subunit type 1 TsaB [Wolbachia endosymbiont of Tyrophagus putrescentiae]|nr:tRNA (adenosine(37)-N6)-threonylcarbamoyltransferase complex dimerization subunit type 1 TsaB [Wolbachia endosymbiont of Tyrophagus putrescentiae]
MSILAINTVGTGSSIAIVNYDGSYLIEHNSEGNSHAESFFRILDTLFAKHNYDYDKIDHLAVVVGPGSFTGIRVGISAAQGMSLATGKPLYGVSTLEAKAYAIFSSPHYNKENIQSVIEDHKVFYIQLFDHHLLPISKPEVLNKDKLDTHEDCHFSASHAGLLVLHRLKNKQKLNPAEALYLNDPDYIRS